MGFDYNDHENTIESRMDGGGDVPGENEDAQWVTDPQNEENTDVIKYWASLRYRDPTMLFRPVGHRVGPNGLEDGPLEFFIGDENDANSFKKIEHPDQISLEGNGNTLFSMEDWRFAEPLLRLCKEYYDAIPGPKANQVHQCA